MPSFKVKLYDRGSWDRHEPCEIEAKDELEAAQEACRSPLSEVGKAGLLRAEVWSVALPIEKKLFYLLEDE